MDHQRGQSKAMLAQMQELHPDAVRFPRICETCPQQLLGQVEPSSAAPADL